jgi:hypothetical protein
MNTITMPGCPTYSGPRHEAVPDAGDTISKIALENLHRPIEEGGLDLIDIKARNDAIELTWLKDYLDFSPSRPVWAKITDLIIDASMPQGPNTQARINTFL